LVPGDQRHFVEPCGDAWQLSREENDGEVTKLGKFASFDTLFSLFDRFAVASSF